VPFKPPKPCKRNSSVTGYANRETSVSAGSKVPLGSWPDEAGGEEEDGMGEGGGDDAGDAEWVDGILVHPDNGMPFRPTAGLVPGLPGPVVSISAGFAHSAAVLADGRIFTWGADFDGQLGQGSIRPCVPGEGGNSITLPGDHVPRQVCVGAEGGGGAVAVSVGSSHSLALVQPEAFARYPLRCGNGTGLAKNWWPCLRDLLEEVDDEDWGRGRVPPRESGVTADDILETHMRGLRLEEPVYRHNWTDDLLSRVAGCDMAAQPLRVSDPLSLFQTTRSYFTNDASTQLREILPNVRPVVVQDEQWPTLKHIEWRWKNVTREEAMQANMPYPQQYRDGYGANAPSPEEAEALLHEARQIYLRHGGAGMEPNSPQERSARAETRALLDTFYQSLCVRDAENAGDDARRFLAQGEFEEARKWARKQRIALRHLVDLQGDPRVVEEGRATVEETMLAIDRAEEDANLRKLSEHAALMDELYDTRVRFNSSNERWYRSDPLCQPLDTSALADVPFGCLEVALPVGEGVQDLKMRLCRMLREPPEAVALYYNGTLLESDPPPGVAPLKMIEGGGAWGAWEGTWRERELEAEKMAHKSSRYNMLSRSDRKWLKKESEIIEREQREEREQKEREDEEERKAADGGQCDESAEGLRGHRGAAVHRANGKAPPTRVGAEEDQEEEEEEEEEKGRMINKWTTGLHGWFKNEDEELEVVSSSWIRWLFALRRGGLAMPPAQTSRPLAHSVALPVRDFGVVGANCDTPGGGHTGGGAGSGAGVVGDVAGDWQARGALSEVETACGMRGPWPCGCHVPLRIETISPALAFAREDAVVQVCGYGFCNHSSWLVVFGDDQDGSAGDLAEAAAAEEEYSESDSWADSEDGMAVFVEEGAARRRRRYVRGAVSTEAEVFSCRSLALRVPPHAPGNVTVRIYRNHTLVARIEKGFEYLRETFDLSDHAKMCGIVLRIRLRHAALPPDYRTELVSPLHLRIVTKHHVHASKYKSFLNESAPAGARESALALDAMYRELLFWEPARKASLHNYGVFLEDVMANRSAAEWLYKYGGLDVEPSQYVDDDSSSENFREDLEHIPPRLHAEARMNPQEICWPWSDPVKDAPSGTYHRHHFCYNESCPIPNSFDPERDMMNMRGCFNGPPVPLLPGDAFNR